MEIIATISKTDEINSLEIKIDDKYKFHVHEDVYEHQANTLDENFSDCHNILEMMTMAYRAGRNGEKLYIKRGYEGDAY